MFRQSLVVLLDDVNPQNEQETDRRINTRTRFLGEVETANEMQKIQPCDPAENNKQEETEVKVKFHPPGIRYTPSAISSK